MIYKSNAKQVLGGLAKKLKSVQIGFDKELRVIASTTKAEVMWRVFNVGRGTNGRRIGSYSTKQMLATKSQFVKKSAFRQTKIKTTSVVYSSSLKTKSLKAKKGRALNRPLWIKFKNASKAVPVMVLPNGYKEFRQIQGRESSYVNLQLSGKLKSSMVMEPITGGWAIGFLPYGAKISLYQEQHWGKLIWETSSREQKIINQLANKYIAKKLK